MFTFDDGLQDTTLAPDTWKPGDDWTTRATAAQLDNRDKSLENHVNADYVRREFTVRLTQVGVITLGYTSAEFTRAAKVHVELTITAASAGVAGLQIYVTPKGLPAGVFTGSLDGASMGTFVYYQVGASNAIAGSCLWDGTFLLFYAGGLHAFAGLGADPNFAIAAGDILVANFAYWPAP